MKKIFTVSTLSLLICSGCISSPNYIQKPPKDESYVPRNHNSQSNRITSIAKDNHRRDPRHNEVVNYNSNHSSSYSSSQSSSSSSTAASGNSSSYSYSYSDGNGSSSYSYSSSYSSSNSNNNNNYNDNYNNDNYYDCDGNDNDSYYDYGDNNYDDYNEDNYYEDTYETNCNNAPSSNQNSTSGTSNLGHIPSNTSVISGSVANLLTHQAANNNQTTNTNNSNSDSNEQQVSNNSNEQYANDDSNEQYANDDSNEQYANDDSSEQYANDDDSNEQYANNDDSNEQYANNDDSNEQSANNDSNGSLGTSSTGLNRNAVLLEHNKARQEVGIGNLTWSSELEQVAQNYAEVIANKCSLVHSNNKKYGENLFMGTKGYYTASDGVKSWVDEKKDYDYDTNTGYGKVVGHYTQVVWKNTTQVGCGQAIGCGNMWLVCNYNPPGNYNNQRPY